MNTEKTKQSISGKKPRFLTGKVVSTKMKNTIVVAVDRYFKHAKYGKFLTRTTRFKAHDVGNTCHEGDIVYIRETKPFSKDKRFELVEKKVAIEAGEATE